MPQADKADRNMPLHTVSSCEPVWLEVSYYKNDAAYPRVQESIPIAFPFYRPYSNITDGKSRRTQRLVKYAELPPWVGDTPPQTEVRISVSNY